MIKIKIGRYRNDLPKNERLQGVIYESNQAKVIITPLFADVFRLMTIEKSKPRPTTIGDEPIPQH